MRVSEIFYSIQGEGVLSGTPSVFVRLAGCNLSCSWCDTKYASRDTEGEELTVDEIIRRVAEYPARHFVLTGGEPMIADEIHCLAERLNALGKHVTIETNATVAPDGIRADLASLSPKLRHSQAKAGADPPWRLDVLRDWIDRYDYQLKFVVKSEGDILEVHELLGMLERYVPSDKVLLMPEGVDMDTVRGREAMVAGLCKEHGYRYCRRLHLEMYGGREGI